MKISRSANGVTSRFPSRYLITAIFVILQIVPLCEGGLTAQPKLRVIGGVEYKLGVIPEDTVYTKTLILKNTGDDTLLIQNVRTSCGCTVAKAASDRIAPGDSMGLPISFNTKNFDGAVKKDIYFETNDTSVAKVDIVLLATIRAVVEMRPHYLNFHEVSTGIPAYLTDTLINNSDEMITIDSIIVRHPEVTASVKDSTIPPHHSVIIRAALNARKKGNLLGQIEFTTNSSTKPRLTLSYMAYARK